MRQPSKVWVQDQFGKLSIIFLKPGVTDNNYTEILKGDLKEGQLVITGVGKGLTQGDCSGESAEPDREGPMMFTAAERTFLDRSKSNEDG